MKSFPIQIMEYIRNNLVDVLLISSFMLIFLIFNVIYSKDVEEMDIMKAKKIANSGLEVDTTDLSLKDLQKEHPLCEKHKGESHILEQKCNSLHENSCNDTECCVYASFKDEKPKCVAGNNLGPTFTTDNKGNDYDIDYYYYQHKCYGKGCKDNN